MSPGVYTVGVIGLGQIGFSYDVDLPKEIVLTHARAASLHPRTRLGWGVDLDSDRLILAGNPYLDTVVTEINDLRAELELDATRILYLSEPVEEALIAGGPEAQDYGYTGEGVLEALLSALEKHPVPVAELVVRLHPLESRSKYDYLLARERLPFPVSISFEDDLTVDLATSSLAVGAQTMALVVAMAAGIPAISYLPEGSLPNTLPHNELHKAHTVDQLGKAIKTLFAAR